MTEETIELQVRLTQQLRYWTWYFVLYSYDSSHLVIADEFFINHLKKAIDENLNCRTATPDEYEDMVTPDIKKILVFTLDDELAIVRKLQAQFSDILVTSATYGYALTGKDRYPRLVEFQPGNHIAAQRPKQTVVFLSSPYADAEFIISAMVENGYPYIHEFLARPFTALLPLCSYFQATRFHYYAEKRYMRDGFFGFLLQTDVLQSLIDNTSFKLRHFIRYLKHRNVRLVLVKRRDHITQAVTAQLFDRTAERSVWTKKPSKKLLTPVKPGDSTGSLQHLQAIAEGETMMDTLASTGIAVHEVFLEDFVMKQADSIRRLADFLGHDLSVDTPETIDYAQGYETAPVFNKSVTEIRRELMDRLGIHVLDDHNTLNRG